MKKREEITQWSKSREQLANRIEQETGIKVDRYKEEITLTLVMSQKDIDDWQDKTGYDFVKKFSPESPDEVIYTEEQLFKAVRYALEAQKRHDYQIAGELLITDNPDKSEGIKALLDTLYTTKNTFGAFAFIDREEVLNHVKNA